MLASKAVSDPNTVFLTEYSGVLLDETRPRPAIHQTMLGAIEDAVDMGLRLFHADHSPPKISNLQTKLEWLRRRGAGKLFFGRTGNLVFWLHPRGGFDFRATIERVTVRR